MIPLIQDAEARWRQLLEQARAQAEEEVRSAEREAASALAQAREEIPRRLEGRHQEEVARLQLEPGPGTGEQEELARRAERNLERAVQAIMQAVWEGP